jgi:hypothetical protein
LVTFSILLLLLQIPPHAKQKFHDSFAVASMAAVMIAVIISKELERIVISISTISFDAVV